ncbi:hypothetical protein LV779_26480 [Streptomyces thinghirensis]|nr:hypothetical protein [Streptomyces thinghirensis]
MDASDLARITEETGARKAPLAADDGTLASGGGGAGAAGDAVGPQRQVRGHRGELRRPAHRCPAGPSGRVRRLPGASPSSGTRPPRRTPLKSLANNRYVAEKNFTGSAQNVLRARSTSVGAGSGSSYYNEDLDRLGAAPVHAERSLRHHGERLHRILQYALRARSTDITGLEEFVLYDSAPDTALSNHQVPAWNLDTGGSPLRTVRAVREPPRAKERARCAARRQGPYGRMSPTRAPYPARVPLPTGNVWQRGKPLPGHRQGRYRRWPAPAPAGAVPRWTSAAARARSSRTSPNSATARSASTVLHRRGLRPCSASRRRHPCSTSRRRRPPSLPIPLSPSSPASRLPVGRRQIRLLSRR